jgi:hypothetical protein
VVLLVKLESSKVWIEKLTRETSENCESQSLQLVATFNIPHPKNERIITDFRLQLNQSKTFSFSSKISPSNMIIASSKLPKIPQKLTQFTPTLSTPGTLHTKKAVPPNCTVRF